MKHTSHTLAIRAWELKKQGLTEEQAGQQLLDELAREAIGYTIAEVRDAVVESSELLAATQFVNWAGDAWYGSEANRQLLEDRAHEYDGVPYTFNGLTAAFMDLQDEGLLESRPEPEAQPTPEPTAEPKTAPEPTEKGPYGVLTVDPETRAELNKLSLAELKRRANADRWANMDPKRRMRLRHGFSSI